jgi:SsrA-binding protein
LKTLEIRERLQRLITRNRRAEHDFIVLHRFEAGVVLTGTEVKSLRESKCSIQDSYAAFTGNNSHEIFLINFHISPYTHGNRENHEPKRPRKLLLNLRETNKLRVAIQEKGLTIIPLQVYFSGPFVKIEIGVVKAKHKYDKRESTKERETDREIQRKYRV